MGLADHYVHGVADQSVDRNELGALTNLLGLVEHEVACGWPPASSGCARRRSGTSETYPAPAHTAEVRQCAGAWGTRRKRAESFRRRIGASTYRCETAATSTVNPYPETQYSG